MNSIGFEHFLVYKRFDFKKITNFLDIGCDDCALFKLITKENPGIKCIGVEPKKTSKEFQVITPSELFKVQTKFDLITMLEVIEHLYFEEAVNYLDYAAEHLKEDGAMVISTPNVNNISILMNFWGDYDHIKPYTIEAITLMASKSDLKVVRVEKIKHLFHPGKFLINLLLGFDNHNGFIITLKKGSN